MNRDITIKYPKEPRNKNGAVFIILTFIAFLLLALLFLGGNNIVVFLGFILFFVYIIYLVWTSEIYELTSEGLKITGEYTKKEQLIPFSEIKKVEYTKSFCKYGFPSKLIYIHGNFILPKCFTFTYGNNLEFDLFRSELERGLKKFSVPIKDYLDTSKKL